MSTHILFSLWFFSYTIIIHHASTMAQFDNYIIHMDTSAMPKAFSDEHHWYLSTLSSALATSKFTATNNVNPNAASSKLIYTYTNAMNGFSASLSPTELEALKTSPGYISSTRDSLAKLDTTHSPQFLGLSPNSGAWHASEFGEDVIVGLVDSGIWPESKSYRDDGLTPIPSRWKGECENGKKFKKSLCNKKLIGARFFNKGLLAKFPNATLGVNSTRDMEGHGTHTSSTAAGSLVENVSYFGYANGTANGIATRARVAMYKPFWIDGAYMSDIVAAIDRAISDGVDVLSLSFGFNDVPLYDDPVAIGTFAAMEKGVFVSTSAGNDGPTLATLHNGTPWVITVAAGTLDREFNGILTLDNGVKITGSSLYSDNFPSNFLPLVFLGSCNDSKLLIKAKDKIVICEDKEGTSIGDQVGNVDRANVTGAVFISNSFDAPFFYQNSFASIVIDPKNNGEIIKAYVKSHNDSKGSMSFKITSLGTRPAPSVDSYSSRGPSKSSPSVLKPDITAPGTSILAAWPRNLPVVEFGDNKLFSDYNLLSGTSMACPHVAGVGALLRGAHFDWSPAAIRSAIMTTSDSLDNTMGFIKDVGDDYNRASPLALGAGHVNPNRALDPGLVYDVGVQDYVNLLCAMNFTQKNISVITRSSSNDCSHPSLDLNYPSFIAFFNANASLTESREFHRTVTNVGDGEAIYVANVTPIKGFHVSVLPKKLVFKEKNEKLSYNLRIEGPRKTKVDAVAFGYLTWTDVKHVVKSPIVVTTLNLELF